MEKLSRHEAASIAARARWKSKRIVSLDGLDPDTRRLVLAFVDMAKATETRKAAAVSDDASDGRAEVRGGSLERTAA